MKSRIALRSVVMFVFWIGLTASLHWQEMLVGVIASIVTAWVSLKIAPEDPESRPSIISWLKFIPILLWEIVVANIDVTKRVLSPKIKVNPGFVLIPTTLKSTRKKWYLAQAITLTPGTVTADIIGDHLLVHWIDIKEGTPKEQGRVIKERFERVLV